VNVVAPPPQTDADERSLDERVADLEALIKEARQRTRRRRRRNGAVALAALLAAGAALVAGGDGFRVQDARSADDDGASAAALDRARVWSTPTGPPGFSARLVLHPTRPGALYLYAGGRVYRSTNGGRSWKSGPPIARKLDALAVDPRNGSILYAGTNDGVLKSTDSGRTWRRSGLRPSPGRPRSYADWEGWVYSIAVDPADSRNVYAVTRGVKKPAAFRSRDAGATWQVMRTGAPRDMTEIHAAGSGILYTAGRFWEEIPDGVLRSTDGGTTWHRVLDGRWSLTVDPNRAGTVWAVGFLGVRVTRDGGTSWESAGPAPARDPSAIVLDPRHPRTLYLSTRQNDVLRSVDGGRSWHPFRARRKGRSGPGPGLTDLLAIDPRKPGTLYAGDGLGVVKTVDGGATWRRADAGVVASHVLRVAPAASNPATIYAAGLVGYRNQQHALDQFLSRSDDRGRTWVRLRTDVSDGSPFAVQPSVLAVDPRDHNHVLVGGLGITGSRDGGATWKSHYRLPHLNDVWVGHIAFAPSNPRQVYAAIGDGPADQGRLIRSSDGGTTWTTDGAAGTKIITAFAVHPQQAETVYAGYEGQNSGAGGVAISSDGGRSWRYRSIPDAQSVNAFAFVPSDPDTIYAATDLGLARSVDGGDRWRLTPKPGYFLRSVVVDPERSETVYATTWDARRGVFRSTNGGATWRPFGTRLPRHGVTELAFDPSANRLYAGSSDGGLTSIRVR
jgi:photosystem II stability/assembly factor-like uncharacterized protein